ncbi:SMI1/KNR4 family protein (plasmid) [Rhizobium sp. 32-5/1]|uniref:SMI1/KNR4 family protein n=1 Tax=Rhizobium sp. 32-5/1 TaxID=3019602 RepID=UPI00240DB4FE|nr:SMI1/KNR4 family protein [Rhizobium sp. 32-5/1]WEZ85595.1 SMI1/KNR4 family protein [Rhizobium sp. 32-5/1]
MFEKLRHGFQQPGASPGEIEECETKPRIALPDDYKAFLSISNGFNDEVGQGYLVLWSIEELSWAGGYELFELRSHRFLIGSNGGPTAYGIIDGNYISFPFVFAGQWEDEVRVLGNSFEAFIAAIDSGEGW